jgi:hypothetical protein
VFPAGRQLPHLQLLDISTVTEPSDRLAAAPEGSRLVSCCPGLQSLDMKYLQYNAEVLSSLHRLSGLHTLRLASGCSLASTWEGLQSGGQLTGLRELCLFAPGCAEGLWLQLPQLKQLTSLAFSGPMGGKTDDLWMLVFTCKVSSDASLHPTCHRLCVVYAALPVLSCQGGCWFVVWMQVTVTCHCRACVNAVTGDDMTYRLFILPVTNCVWLLPAPLETPTDEPVWRQVLRRQLDHSDPAVAQQAAAALAHLEV